MDDNVLDNMPHIRVAMAIMKILETDYAPEVRTPKAQWLDAVRIEVHGPTTNILCILAPAIFAETPSKVLVTFNVNTGSKSRVLIGNVDSTLHTVVDPSDFGHISALFQTIRAVLHLSEGTMV